MTRAILSQAEQWPRRCAAAAEKLPVHTYLSPQEVMGYAREDNEWRNLGKQPRLEKSIATHGIREPIEIDTNGSSHAVIADGHHRAKAALDLGLDKVPVHVRDDPYLDTLYYEDNTIGSGLSNYLKQRGGA